MLRRALSLICAWALILAAPLSFGQVATDAAKTGINRGMHLQCSGGTAATVTGTTNETALATCAIPPGAMGTNGGLLINSTWSHTTSANNKTLRVRLGGIAGTAFLGHAVTTATVTADSHRIKNRNSASSQIGSFTATSGGFGQSSSALVTGTLDTSVAQDLVISCQLALGSESCALENYEVWLLP